MRRFRIICYIWACISAMCVHIFAYEHVYTSHISDMLFLFTQSKCHINIVLNWSTFLVVKSMEIVSGNMSNFFTLILVCKEFDCTCTCHKCFERIIVPLAQDSTLRGTSQPRERVVPKLVSLHAPPWYSSVTKVSGTLQRKRIP